MEDNYSPNTSTTATASAAASSTSSPSNFKNPHDKKGRSTSCLLCQKRKQKCDHRLPSCTTCIKAGVKCVQPAKYAVKAPEKDDYTIMLEKKIKFIERFLDANNISIDQQGNPNVKKNFKYKKLSPFLPEDQLSASANNNNNNNLVINQLLDIPHDRKLPSLSNDFKSSSLNKSYLSLESIDYSNSIFAKYNLKEYLNFDPVFEVDESLSRAFLDIHFTRLQFKYPLFEEDEIFEFHNAYITKRNLTGYMNDLDSFHYNCSRMWMIFAISSCLHMTTGRYKGPIPARYFSTAMRHITKCSNLDGLQKIEILVLTVLYLIRTDRDSFCLYEIIKDALKLSVDLKLNKSQTYWTLLPKERMKKIRIWWCVYLLERMITIAVGKPYSLSESQVDTDLPLFEYYEPANGSTARHPNNVNFINQSIKLRRIESRFVEDLNITSSNDLQTNVSMAQMVKVEKYFQELEIWRGNCQIFSNSLENETLRLYYYRSVRLLLQPYLELMDPTDKLFRECQAAAGHICQLFKAFHEKTVFGHSTTAIHTVFVAGVTVIYCLWVARNKDDLKRRQLGDDSKHTRPAVSASLFNGLNDLRACSICLYVMAERSKFGLIFRDTFDQLMNATITNLIERCGPDSSELIINNEPGMPPAILRKFNNYYKTPNGLINIKETDEEKYEQAERRRKQGQLQKNAVPKSLSHLLINSAPTYSDQDAKIINQHHQQQEHQREKYEHQREQSIKRQKLSPTSLPTPLSTDSTPASIPTTTEVNLNSFQYPMSNYATSTTSTSSTSAPSLASTSTGMSSAISTPQPTSTTTTTTIPSEFTLFNGRTNKMINNISTWTGESGGTPITTSLFDHSNYFNNSNNNTSKKPQQNNNSTNGQNSSNGINEHLLWNVPVEEFWANKDDYGFLA